MKTARKFGDDVGRYRTRILEKKLNAKAIHYVTGHVPCSSAIREKYQQEWAFVTILREPVERFISEYFFNRHKKMHHVNHDFALEHYLEIEEQKEVDHRGLGSYYVRYFADEEHLGTSLAVPNAINNLKQYQLVGFLEDLGPFTLSFRNQFGKMLDIRERKNENLISPASISQQVSKELLQRIEMICKPDMDVYSKLRQHLLLT